MINLDFHIKNNIMYGIISYPIKAGTLIESTFEVRDEERNIVLQVDTRGRFERITTFKRDDTIIVKMFLPGGMYRKVLTSEVLVGEVLIGVNEEDKENILQFIKELEDEWNGKNMIKIEDKTSRMLEVEEEYAKPFNIDLEELFRRMYVDEALSISNMSARLGIGTATVIRWLEQMNITARKLEFKEIDQNETNFLV